MLQLQPYMDDWREQGFDVIFITLTSAEGIARFRADRGVEMDAYFDPEGKMHDAYGVRAIPTTFIVDPGGDIRETTLGWGQGSLEALESWVDALAPGS